MSITTFFLKEKTFVSFTSEQGKLYAKHRTNYHSSVYEHVVDHHKSTGGQTISLLDVGCGPGLATFTLSRYFAQTQGIDPSPAMISTAQSLNPSPETITFHASPAENMSGIRTSSIDLLTAANAAHWFSLPEFWSEAARVLKPGGSVALWATGQAVTHPDLPNSDEIQAAISRHREEHLAPYLVEGNLLNKDGYKNLTMPWDMEPSPVGEFDRASFHRRLWGPHKPFTARDETYSLDEFEMMMATKSPVVRWREANPDKAGTDEDTVRILRMEIQSLLEKTGMKKDHLVYRRRVPGAVLIIKRQ